MQQTSDDSRDSREARLEHELFDQNSVRLKLSKFHADLVSYSSTYQDVPPALKGFQDFIFTNFCQLCSRDKHIPKLYSSAYNMNYQYHLNYKLVQDHLYCNIKSIIV